MPRAAALSPVPLVRRACVSSRGQDQHRRGRRRIREQVAALLEGGVDLFMLETFRDLAEILAAIRLCEACRRFPVVAQMTTGADGNSLDGTPPETFAPNSNKPGRGRDRRELLGDRRRCSRPSKPSRASAAHGSWRSRTPGGRATSKAETSTSLRPITWRATQFTAAGVRLVGGCAAERLLITSADRRDA